MDVDDALGAAHDVITVKIDDSIEVDEAKESDSEKAEVEEARVGLKDLEQNDTSRPARDMATIPVLHRDGICTGACSRCHEPAWQHFSFTVSTRLPSN